MSAGLEFDRVRRLIAASCDDVSERDLAPARDVSILALPPWVARQGLAASGDALWLWVTPHAETADPEMGQASLAVPAGRYVIDVLETVTRTWLSREAAAAPPLVIGLPRRAGPLLARIRRVPEST
jgi:hypothetical protein